MGTDLCSPQVRGSEPEGGLGGEPWGKAMFPLMTLSGSNLLVSLVLGKLWHGMDDGASVGDF